MYIENGSSNDVRKKVDGVWNYQSVLVNGEWQYQTVSGAGAALTGGAGDDHIGNSAAKSTIRGWTGNDYISNSAQA